MNAKPIPSQERLKELFDYKDGCLYWAASNHKFNNRVGRRAGCSTRSIYRRVAIDGKRYPESRLIWAWHHGDIPVDLVVDHINRNKADNRIENLQVITTRENTSNWQKRDLPTGVFKVYNKFRAQADKFGKRTFLGSFNTVEEAVAAREAFIK